MKILLIAPASGKWRHVGQRSLVNGRTFRFSMLSLLSVAAETPADVDIQIIDEQIEPIPWDADVDLVGITCMTALAPRAYQIAQRFRDRSVPVVLGGMHPTLLPDEASQHADAIVIGAAEGIWQTVLSDAGRGKLQDRYESTHTSLRGLIPLPRHLLKPGRYAPVHPVQATRGCPHGCGFCAIAAFSKSTHLKRPVDEVVSEIAQLPGKVVIFVDDNLMADRDYAEELFRALRPLRKKWVTQSTLSVAEDPSFVQLAAESGCIGIFVGMETFSSGNLSSVSKEFNDVAKYRTLVKTIHDHGIGIEAGIVFGFDGDNPTVFQTTLNALESLGIDAIQASILTPIPGTPLYDSMGDRIVDRSWEHYDFHHAVFTPAGMTAEELQSGHDWITREFYRPWRIARRLTRNALRPRGLRNITFSTVLNTAYAARVHTWHIKGRNPARRECIPGLDSKPVFLPS